MRKRPVITARQRYTPNENGRVYHLLPAGMEFLRNLRHFEIPRVVTASYPKLQTIAELCGWEKKEQEPEYEGIVLK